MLSLFEDEKLLVHISQYEYFEVAVFVSLRSSTDIVLLLIHLIPRRKTPLDLQ